MNERKKYQQLFPPTPQMQTLYAWAGLDVDFSLSPYQAQALDRSWANLQQALQGTSALYGVHTHFGAQVDQRVETSYQEHQSQLLEYLQVGVGDPIDEGVVRRALRLQVHKACQGYSGIHPETIQRLVELSNQKSLPRVPRHGSLGASGDLIPMAHAIAPLFADSVKGPRDVLGLVNTNSMMASLAIELWWQLREQFAYALQTIATSFAAIQPNWEFLLLPQREPFCTQRPQVAKLAQALEQLLQEKGSGHKPTASRRVSPQSKPEGKPQARYSIRCAPQILGAICSQMQLAQEWILEEALCISDNPVIDEQGAWHAGLFYTSLLAAATDMLQNCIGKLAELLDRQLLLLMDPQTNGDLPCNLHAPGSSHCKGIHQMLSALNQRLRGMGAPTRLMSFSSESHNQDLVPCSMEALNITHDMLKTLCQVNQGARFCSDRAWQLRQGLPPLHLNQFTHQQA